jgi:hypothetical protein
MDCRGLELRRKALLRHEIGATGVPDGCKPGLGLCAGTAPRRLDRSNVDLLHRHHLLTISMPSTNIDGMASRMNLPNPAETANALAAVVAVRRMADDLEAKAVQIALREGWSWSQIAEALGVSKQAAHRRLSHLQPGRNRGS